MISRRQIISRSVGPIFAIFSPNESNLGADDRSGPIFWYLKGRCHGNQFCVVSKKQTTCNFYTIWKRFGCKSRKNWRLLRTNLLCCDAIRKETVISHFKRLDIMNISTSCGILVTFRPETSEFTLLTIAPFVAIRQKSAYHAKYLRMFWTYLDLLYRIGRRISGDDFTNIRFAAAQWTLLWKPVKSGKRSQTSRGSTFTLCFGIRQRIGRS